MDKEVKYSRKRGLIVEYIKRLCLKCDNMFWSKSIENRICAGCEQTNKKFELSEEKVYNKPTSKRKETKQN